MAATHSLDLESGSSQYASIANASSPNLDITGAQTWEAWIKPESFPSAHSIFGNMDATAATGIQLYIGATGTLTVNMRGLTITSASTAAGFVTAGVWQHVGLKWNGTNEIIIWSNDQTHTTATTGSITAHANAFAIGRPGDYAGNYFDGIIRNVRVWNVARTQQEIRDNMNIDTPVGTGLQGNWILNNAYTDSSSNGYTLTASGSPTFSTTYPDAINLTENNAFLAKHKISIDHTKVAGSSNFTDFPVVFTESNFLPAVFSNTQGQEINTNNIKNKSGLVAYYRMENNFNDSSGNGLTLTATGTPADVTGLFGNAKSFDDTAMWATSNSASFAFTSAMSISGWIKPTSVSGFHYIASRRIAPGTDRGWWFGLNGNQLQLFCVAVGTTISTPVILTNVWTHVAGVYDGSTIKVYVNGVPTSSAATGSMTSPSSDMFLGANSNNTAERFAGAIDDIAFFNTALSQAEVEQIYKGGADLRFSTDSAGKTRLAHEVVSWDTVNKTGEVWVKMNELDYDDNTNLYVHYKNPTASALDENEAFGKHQVYPSKFRATYHTENNIDSTLFSRDLTNNNSVTFSSGKIGKTANFGTSNTNKYLFVANDLGITGGNITLLCWVKVLTEIGSSKYDFVSQGDASTFVDYHIRYDYNSGTRRLQFERVRRGTVANTLNHTLTLGTSDWYHLALTYNGTNVEGYVNGVSVGTAASSGNGASATVDSFGIGADTATSPSITLYASSLIDQVQVVNTALSTDEIQTLYNNQNSPATFARPVGVGGAFLLQFV